MSKKSLKREVLIYIVFGILTTLAGWGAYTLFVDVFSFSVFWANAFSWLIAASFAFLTNKIWVFSSKSKEAGTVLREAASFFAARIFTGVLEIFFVPFLEKLSFDKPFYSIAKSLGITAKVFFTDGIYSKIFVSVFIVIMNYFFSKFVVFKKEKNKKV